MISQINYHILNPSQHYLVQKNQKIKDLLHQKRNHLREHLV